MASLQESTWVVGANIWQLGRRLWDEGRLKVQGLSGQSGPRMRQVFPRGIRQATANTGCCKRPISRGAWGMAESVASSASKFGVIGFTEAVGLEVRWSGVKVSAVEPGPVQTTFSESA